MFNEIEITGASLEDRLPVFRMLELYQHDLSDIWDQDLDVHGEYGYELDRFWQGRGSLALRFPCGWKPRWVRAGGQACSNRRR